MSGGSGRNLGRRLAYRTARAILGVLAAPVYLLPGLVRRGVCLVLFWATARQRPAPALRTLLQIDSDLTRCINHAAMRYEGGVHVKHRLTRYHEFFVDRVRAGERVLDLGCGYGAVAYSIASRAGAIVTGIDLSAENIAQALQRFSHPNLRFIEGDFRTDLPQEPFDIIVMSNVLEHIEHRVQFLRDVQERFAPKRWLIRVPMFNRDWRVPLRKELGMCYFSDETHFIEYTDEAFVAEMEAAGLAVAHMQINWGEIWAEVRSEPTRAAQGASASNRAALVSQESQPACARSRDEG